MIDRRAFIAGSLTALAAPLAADAHGATRRPSRVGLLAHSADTSAPIVVLFAESIRQGLREQGYIEGHNLTVEYRAGALEVLPRLASELAGLSVDVIVTGGTPAGRAVKAATQTIPVVVAAMADPVADGLVASLAKPGGNVTGVTFLGPELGAKRLQLLREILPRMSRLAVLQHPRVYSEQTMRDMLASVRAAAAGMDVRIFEARSADDFEMACSAMVNAHADALIVLPSPMFYVEFRRLVDIANARRLPTVYWFREAVEAGGLMSYGANLPDVFRRSGVYVGKILQGAKPGDLPVEQASKFDLVISVKAAKALGLTIPPSLLLRADQVIE